MSGLKPIFNMGYVQNIFEDYIDERVNREMAVLQKIGEEFVNKAKDNGTYQNWTHNLRNSIGYIIVWDGEIQKQGISGKSEGGIKAKEFAAKIKAEYPKGMILIGFAGMEYAAAVETKGFDVISSSIPTSDIMKQAFEKFLS